MGRYLIFIFIIVALGLPFSGCSKKKPPPPKKKAEVKKEIEIKPEELKPLTEEPVKKSEGYVYNPAGRRDPFAPLIVLRREAKGAEEAKRPPGTLESYDIGDFSLLAIVKKRDRYYALLLAPDNKSFTVNEGDTIGLHNGKVKEISRDRVVIVEYTIDYKGNKKPREVVLELHKEG
jgi:type IV pilus assembly protein PilP